MSKTKTFKAKSTLILQFMAGTEIEYVSQGGKTFVLMPTPEFGEADDDEEEETPKKKGSSKKASEEDDEDEKPASKKPSKKVKEYGEDELMEMENKDLKKLCTELGIDPEKTDGKNTNRKLTNLILAKQKKALASVEDDDSDDEDEAPKKKSKKGEEKDAGSPLEKSVASIIKKLDDGDLNEAKAVTKLMELNEDADKKAVKGVVAKFMEDAEAPQPKFVKSLVAILEGEEADEDDDDDDDEEEEDEKPAKKGKAGKGKKEEEFVEIDDLEEGQEVSVYWKSEKKWYDGTVIKVNSKGVKVHYDEDDSEEFLSEDENTKIKLL